MVSVSKKTDLIEIISQFRRENRLSVGFVPTMGFLHQGHGSLIQKSLSENGLTVCDIFVNPLQFNQKSDFDNYPSDIQKDIDYLEKLGCDILYIPRQDDIYPLGHEQMKYDFGHIEAVMEGKHRPGHFQGVAEVVRILLEIVRPDRAYFGEKDFQQLKIIETLVKQFQFPVEIIPCPIIREEDGLAMSSRNARLTPEQRIIAPFIFQQLKWCVNNYNIYTPGQLKREVENSFQKRPEFQLEYVEIADCYSLKSLEDWTDAQSARVFIAAWLGNIRLIDNILLF